MSRSSRSRSTEPEGVLRLSIDEREITAHEGQSVAAALLDAGIRSWRKSRVHAKPRGLFCGIGVCYDCLLSVDGIANQRACLVPARNGMQLRTDATATSEPPLTPGSGRP
jgi:predicted molibdopterin-dependent oxidoreductase YjgC